MLKKTGAVLCLTLGLATLGLLLAQDEPRISPHEQTSANIGGVKVTITYGRPSMKGREIFGDLVPYGEVWRTGADEATVLTTDGDLTIGDLEVPAGSYSVFTIPNEDNWVLTINKTDRQFGAFKYDKSADLGRTTMQVASTPGPVEQFTITVEPKGENEGVLKMMWAGTMASVPIKAASMDDAVE